MNLELMAMRWLWLEKNCHYILEQRSPRHHLGSPDVLGVTAGRYLIEIEIKRSRSDFRVDAQKYCRRNRDIFPDHMAKQFYYLMPRELALKVSDQIPDWAGLMCDSEFYHQTCQVLKPAPVNKASKKLTVKECVKLTRCMTNHMMALALRCARNDHRSVDRDDQLYVLGVPAEHGTYQI